MSEAQRLLKNFKNLVTLVDSNRDKLSGNLISVKRTAFWVKLVILVFSSGITLALGLKLGAIGSTIGLVLSFLLTIITGMDQFLNLTTHHITVSKRLILMSNLQLDLMFYLEGTSNPSEEKFLEFKKRYDDIMNELLDKAINMEQEILKSSKENQK